MRLSDATAIYIGSDPVSRLYLGSDLIWSAEPAVGEITFVGQDFRAGVSANPATVPMPAHQPGDLIIAYVWHTSASGLPTLDGSAGFEEIGEGFQSANTGLRAAWKYASGSELDIGANTSPGNWVAAVQVWRTTRRLLRPIGTPAGWAITTGANVTARYPGLVLEQGDIGSVVATALVGRANHDLQPRTGIAHSAGKRSAAPRLELGGSPGPVAAWPQIDMAAAGNSETAGIAIELLRSGPVMPQTFDPYSLFANGEAGFWPGGFDPTVSARFMTTRTPNSFGQLFADPPAMDSPVSSVQSLIGAAWVQYPTTGWLHVSGSGAVTIDGSNVTVEAGTGNNDIQASVGRPPPSTKITRLRVRYNSGRADGIAIYVASQGLPLRLPAGGSGQEYTLLNVVPDQRFELIRAEAPSSVDLDILEWADTTGLAAVAPNGPARPLLRSAGGRFHVEADGVDDAMPVDLPAGTYTRAWVTNTGAVTIEGGVAISGPEDILRAPLLADVLYVDRALTPAEAAGLTGYWQGLYA